MANVNITNPADPAFIERRVRTMPVAIDRRHDPVLGFDRRTHFAHGDLADAMRADKLAAPTGALTLPLPSRVPQ